MAIFPNGNFKPVARFRPGQPLHLESPGQRRVILHTAVSNRPSLFTSMNQPGTPTSHFYVSRNGDVEQYVDTDIRSSANLEGNHDCLTIESWDGFGEVWHEGDPVPPWNDDQIEGLTELVAWLCMTHAVPTRRLPSSLRGTRGIGWHRQGIDGNFPRGLLSGRRRDGERWSESTGKACPGDARIRQAAKTIIPGAAGKLGSPQRINAFANGLGSPGPKGPRVSLSRVQQQAQALTPHPGVRQIQKALNKKLDLSLKVNGLFDPATRDAYRRWQRKLGFTGNDADGIPGSLTLTKLGQGKFTVIDED